MQSRIRVQGHLRPTFHDRFGELCFEQQEAGTTLLSGTLPDQAALSGVLLQLIRLGLLLLSLETSETSGREEPCRHQRNRPSLLCVHPKEAQDATTVSRPESRTRRAPPCTPDHAYVLTGL